MISHEAGQPYVVVQSNVRGRDLSSFVAEVRREVSEKASLPSEYYVSVIVLASLLLKALFGWWWADPVAALAMVPIIAKEVIEGVQGEQCDDGCRAD